MDAVDDTKKPEPVLQTREIKRSPNRLIVDEATGDGDNSCVHLSLAKMEGVHCLWFVADVVAWPFRECVFSNLSHGEQRFVTHRAQPVSRRYRPSERQEEARHCVHRHRR